VAEKIKFVKMAGVLLVGKEIEGGLKSPRMVFANSETQQISLSRCIGNPEIVFIPSSPDFQYYNEDKEFEKFYLTESTDIPGLQIVK
jgi:hypothetical protein